MKGIIIATVMVLFLAGCSERAPSGRGTGLIIESDREYKLLDYVKMIRSFSKDPEKRDRANLPESVDLSKYFPGAGNQGAQGSCVPWAASYGVKSFHEYREFGWPIDDANHLFSPSYVYNKINDGSDNGTTLLKAIKFMQADGAVPLSVMPYDDLDYATQPTGEQIALGKNFRVEAYRKVSEKNVDELKRHIASEEPVLFVMDIYPNMIGAGFKKGGSIYSEKKGELLAYHAVVLVGYDDKKGAFKFLNSWGEKWGENGYGWLTYKFLPKVAKRAYVIYDSPSPGTMVAYLSEIKAGDVSEYDYVAGDPEEFHAAMSGAKKEAAREELKPKPADLAVPPPEVKEKKKFFMVPEERGLYINGRWIRIGDPMSKAKVVFEKEPELADNISSIFENEYGRTVFVVDVGGDRIGQISFLDARLWKSAGQTNRGLRVGSTKEDAHRMYGTSDYTDDLAGTIYEYYFYEAVSDDFGGLDWVRNITLELSYDDEGKVSAIRLLKTDKGAMMGTYKKEFEEGEKEVVGGTLEIESDDLSFTVPKGFETPSKNEWGDLGYGYLTKTADGEKGISVKIFNFKKQLKEDGEDDALEKYIKGDLARAQVEESKRGLKDVSYGNASWKVNEYDITFSHFLRLYTVEGKKLFAIQIISDDAAWLKGDDVKSFLNSIELD